MNTVFRILGIVFSLLLMTGFGVCGAFGLIGGLGSGQGGGFLIVCGLAGLLIAGLFLIALLAIIKSGKPHKDDA